MEVDPLQQPSCTKKARTDDLLSLVVVADRAEPPMPQTTPPTAPDSEIPSSPPDARATAPENEDATPPVETTTQSTERTGDDTDGSSHGTNDGFSDDASHVSVSDGMARANITDTDGIRERHSMDRTPADEKLISVYGDTVHRNCGTHLTGGVADDEEWQFVYRRVVSYDHQKYELPPGKVGKRFVSTLALEFKGVRERRWNSERPLIFPAVILCKSRSVTNAGNIRARIWQRLDLWDAGEHVALINDCIDEAKMRTTTFRAPSFEAKARRFNNLVLDGRLRAAVRGITSRDAGGLLYPNDKCTKNPDKTVRQVLEEKHPALRVPDLAAPDCPCFEPYQTVPKAIPVSCSGDAVSKIAPHLSGGAGPSGVDAVALRYWLTRFERASGELRSEMALWQDWLANLSPPWAAYRALMARRLVALDKKPGVRPVGIGEIFQRLLAKLVIADAGDQAKLACGSKQLCAGLEAGIEGTLHAVRRWVSYPTENIEDPLTPLTNSNNPENPDDLSDTRSDDDSLFSADPQDPPAMRPGEGLTLVDATNGFNELSRMTMLWTVRHLWPKGSRFAFNSYRHAALLVVRNRTRDAEFLASCEGVTQGDPLSMILYGIALIPLVELLRHDCPEVMQPWYADDLALLGRHAANARCLKLLTKAGPFFGYFPNPGKSWYVCDAVDEDEARAAIDAAGLDIQFSRGQRYVGGFIGTEDTRQEWLKPMIQQWVDGVKTLAAVASRFPQTAYAGMASSLQAEWQYVCRVVPGIAAELAPVETAIRSDFLPSLFGGSTPMAIDDDFRRLLGHSVKMGGSASVTRPRWQTASLRCRWKRPPALPRTLLPTRSSQSRRTALRSDRRRRPCAEIEQPRRRPSSLSSRHAIAAYATTSTPQRSLAPGSLHSLAASMARNYPRKNSRTRSASVMENDR